MNRLLSNTKGPSPCAALAHVLAQQSRNRWIVDQEDCNDGRGPIDNLADLAGFLFFHKGVGPVEES